MLILLSFRSRPHLTCSGPGRRCWSPGAPGEWWRRSRERNAVENILIFRYVGSHCVVELLKEDFNVICIDNFVNSHKGAFLIDLKLDVWCQMSGHENPESISRVQALTGKHVTFFEADITDKDSLRQVPKINQNFCDPKICGLLLGVLKISERWSAYWLRHSLRRLKSSRRVVCLAPEVLREQRDWLG